MPTNPIQGIHPADTISILSSRWPRCPQPQFQHVLVLCFFRDTMFPGVSFVPQSCTMLTCIEILCMEPFRRLFRHREPLSYGHYQIQRYHAESRPIACPLPLVIYHKSLLPLPLIRPRITNEVTTFREPLAPPGMRTILVLHPTSSGRTRGCVGWR